MTGRGTKLLMALEGLRPSVRRRRREAARISERIEAQAVPDGAFECESCERVQSRFAVGGIAETDAESVLWCLDCVAEWNSEEVDGGRRLGGVRRE